eukprot:TRINITY_DN7105_c0_g1_i1.p1 TRINITY_DN7105_c0_g1~~TRINITY_DN7105_c0_g1_i1.p1  ORF type:complete len:610 (+),score=129.15 TRINITY_DN7105_c0_g1_i1:178-2007(+)
MKVAVRTAVALSGLCVATGNKFHPTSEVVHSRFTHANDVETQSPHYMEEPNFLELSQKVNRWRRKGGPHLRHSGLLAVDKVTYENLGLVPVPDQVVPASGEAPLVLKQGAKVVVKAQNKADKDALLEHVLQKAKVSVADDEGKNSSDATVIELKLDKDAKMTREGKLGDEAYTLSISGKNNKVQLVARTSHGLFNGMMTLRQLLYTGESNAQLSSVGVTIPSLTIKDGPAKEWRGMMIDVSRHFFAASDIKKMLHTMALFKMNRFHWHLTDDQGWRPPIEKYPKLTEVGAWREGTQVGHDEHKHDHQRYGGHYSKEDIHDVVKYAASLHIEVIPETDLPGHSKAAIASYPELGNKNAMRSGNPKVETQFGGFKWTMGPSNFTTSFIEDVVGEISNMIPGAYYHVGGDEVPVDQWQGSSEAISFMKRKQNGNLQHLAGLFNKKAIQEANKHGRRGIVWDEALTTHTKLPNGTISMLWRSWEGMRTLTRRAKDQGLSVVMCPQDRTYLDAWQDTRHSKYDAIGGFTNLEKTYSTSLYGYGADVLGGQVQLWSEYIREGLPNLEYMAWPRGIAMAEATWSDDHRPGFEDFKQRLQVRIRDLSDLKVNYHPIQ